MEARGWARRERQSVKMKAARGPRLFLFPPQAPRSFPRLPTSLHAWGARRQVEQFWRVYSFQKRPSEIASGDYHLFREGIKPIWEVRTGTRANARWDRRSGPSEPRCFRSGVMASARARASAVLQDPANENGGKWMIRLRKGLASRLWESLVRRSCVLALPAPPCRSPRCPSVPPGLTTVTHVGSAQLLAVIGEQFDVGDEICGVVLSVRPHEDILALWTRTAADHNTILSIRCGVPLRVCTWRDRNPG